MEESRLLNLSKARILTYMQKSSRKEQTEREEAMRVYM